MENKTEITVVPRLLSVMLSLPLGVAKNHYAIKFDIKVLNKSQRLITLWARIKKSKRLL